MKNQVGHGFATALEQRYCRSRRARSRDHLRRASDLSLDIFLRLLTSRNLAVLFSQDHDYDSSLDFAFALSESHKASSSLVTSRRTSRNFVGYFSRTRRSRDTLDTTIWIWMLHDSLELRSFSVIFLTLTKFYNWSLFPAYTSSVQSFPYVRDDL